jgi:hypothetical protein
MCLLEAIRNMKGVKLFFAYLDLTLRLKTFQLTWVSLTR